MQQQNKENAVVIATLKEQVSLLEAEQNKSLEEKKHKKKKLRDFHYTDTSYAVEEVSSGEIIIERHSSNTSSSVFSSRAQNEILHTEDNIDLDFSTKYHPSRKENTLGSDIMEYGTLTDYSEYGKEEPNTEKIAPNKRSSRDGSDSQLKNSLRHSEESSNTFHIVQHPLYETDKIYKRKDDDITRSSEHLPTYNPSKYVENTSSTGIKDMKISCNSLALSANSIATAATTASDHVSSSATKRQSNSKESRNSPKRITETTPDGVRITKYSNGTLKKLYPDGLQEVLFLNSDSKITHTDGTVVYYYANAKTTHTTCLDGSEIYEFPNGQVNDRCIHCAPYTPVHHNYSF